MGFRFRRRVKLLPGISLNISKNGFSSLSLGGPGATANIPIARSGGIRGTVGIPGSGLSYTAEATGPAKVRKPRRRRPDLSDLPDPNKVSFAEWSAAYDAAMNPESDHDQH